MYQHYFSDLDVLLVLSGDVMKVPKKRNMNSFSLRPNTSKMFPKFGSFISSFSTFGWERDVMRLSYNKCEGVRGSLSSILL